MRVGGVLLWAWLGLVTVAAHDVARRETSGGSKRVVCYYTNWSVYRPGTAKFNPQNINPYLCTHLIYAFGGLTRENGLRPYDKYQDIEQGGYAKFTGLKTYNKQLKTMLAIGGWNEGSTRFSPLVASVERRGEFVKNVVRFLRQNHFDGLDLDWEYPAFRDGGKARDRDNYAQLVQELREEFDRESSKTGRPRLLLTMAVPAGIEYIDKGYDIPKLNKYLDFMNILSYDYHSSFEPSVNHHSPLYPLEEEGEYNFDAQLSIDYTINHYLKLGADRDKLVLGIPTYGRSYTLFNPLATEIGAPADGPGEQGDATREKGYLAYYEICENLQNSDDWKVEKPNEKAMGPYAYKGNQWVGYDDEDIVRKKARYVTEMGLGGIMYWAIDNDDFRGKCHGRPYPLIEAGKEAMLAGSSTSNELGSTLVKNKNRLRGRSSTTEEPPVRNSGGGSSRKNNNNNNKRRRPSSKARAQDKRTSTSTTSTSTTPAYEYPSATPEPPTTPDPGSDFKCEDEGFFPHPRDCKKYFWCLDSGPSQLGIVAHQFTCPSGLFFNKAADSCDYTRNVVCNKKNKDTTTTSTTAAPKTASTTSRALRTTTRTTTTTTTTEAPDYEEEYEEYDDEADQPEEDPKAIKELIDLIKKLGGIENLEKQLHLDDTEKSKPNSATPPAISKKLFDRVLSQANVKANSRVNSRANGDIYNPSAKPTTQHTLIFRNRGRPQNEGLDHLEEVTALRHEKPQYVTIKRNRPTTPIPADDSEDDNDDDDEEDDKSENTAEEVSEEKPRERAYVNIRRDRPTKVVEDDVTTPKYVTIRRSRPSVKPEVESDSREVSSTVASKTLREPAALVQELTPVTQKKKYNFAPRTPKRGVLPESKEKQEVEEDVTVANEKDELVEETVNVTAEEQAAEVSGSNQKKYVEITRGRGSSTVTPPAEAELTTVNIPAEPSSESGVAITIPFVYLTTVTDETTNENTDSLPLQTLFSTIEPTTAPESVTKKSRFFQSSKYTSSQPTTEAGTTPVSELTSPTSARPVTSPTPRVANKRNRFFKPSSTASQPSKEVIDSITLDNSNSSSEEPLTPTGEVKKNRFFRPSANKTQSTGGTIDTFSTTASPASPEAVAKRNRFFRPSPNKSQTTEPENKSLPVNTLSTTTASDNLASSPDEVTKRSRFYRPSSRKQATDRSDTLIAEASPTSEEGEDNTIPSSTVSEFLPGPTTTPFTPTVTRVVTSVTESGTTERQRISLSKYKGYYLTLSPPSYSTPPPQDYVATEHSLTTSVLFENSTVKMEKIMEVNRLKHITISEDSALPYTKPVEINSTTPRSDVDGKLEDGQDKIKEINRLSMITVVDGDEVTSPSVLDTDANDTNVPDIDVRIGGNQKEEQANEISQNGVTTITPEVTVSTPRLISRGRTRINVRGSTTRAPIPNGLRSSLQRRRTTTLRPSDDVATDNVDEDNTSRKPFVPRGRGSYRPTLRGNREEEFRSTTEAQENNRRFRPSKIKSDEQNKEEDSNSGLLFKIRGRKKTVTESPDEDQTTYEDDTRSSTNANEGSDKNRFTPQFKNRIHLRPTSDDPDHNIPERGFKSVTRSKEETAKLFPRLRTTETTDESVSENEFKSSTRSQEDTAKLFPRLRTTETTDESILENEFKSSTRSQEDTAKLFPRLRTTETTDESISENEFKSSTRSQEVTAKLFPRLRTTETTDESTSENEFKSSTRSQEVTAKPFPRLRTTETTDESTSENEFKSSTRSQEDIAKLFPRLRTTETTDENISETTISQEETTNLFPGIKTTETTDENVLEDEFKSSTRSQEETNKLFPRLKTTETTDESVPENETANIFSSSTIHTTDKSILDNEFKSSTTPQKESNKLSPRPKVSDRKASTSRPSRIGPLNRTRNRYQDFTTKSPGEVSSQLDDVSTEVTRTDGLSERKRERVVKKRRRRPINGTTSQPNDTDRSTPTLTSTSPTAPGLELSSETFGLKETTTQLYITDTFIGTTTRTTLTEKAKSNTVFEDEINFSTYDEEEAGIPERAESGRDEVLETQYSSRALETSHRGSQKFSFDSSLEDDANDVTDDTTLFKKLSSSKGQLEKDRKSTQDVVQGGAGAKRRRVIKKKLLPSQVSRPEGESTRPRTQSEVTSTTTRSPLRRPGGSFLANNRLRSRSTTASTTTTTTEASTSSKSVRRRGPSLPRLNIIRRRKFGDNTTAEVSTSERTITTTTPGDEKDVTIESSRKFSFPRRRTKVVSRGKVVASTSKPSVSTLRQDSDSQNEPSTIEDVQTLEPDDHLEGDIAVTTSLPDLANVAVVAIHQLATQPSIRPAKKDKVFVGTTAVYRAQAATLPTTPKISTTIVPVRFSSAGSTIAPRGRGTAIYVTTTAAPIPRRQIDPFKPRPFSKVTAAVIPNSQTSSLEDYEYYDNTDGLLDIMPSAGKVKIHGDGYIECLDQGSFPHPFSCKQFISCAKMENGDVLGWEYTCPRHLSYDPIGGICNWSAGLGCKE